ncbi:MAG: GNAT family N-acetyltransferase [Spirochaetaceae bacterium]|nr:GNAT family N-acetyltransferase [Spirochaetaceae bacterium]
MHPLGICLDGEMTGFILYDFDKDLDGWSMSRFLIDRRHQGKGLGRLALKTFLEYSREKRGDVELHTSAETSNAPPIA